MPEIFWGLLLAFVAQPLAQIGHPRFYDYIVIEKITPLDGPNIRWCDQPQNNCPGHVRKQRRYDDEG